MVVSLSKGVVAAEEEVGDDADSPHVDRFTVWPVFLKISGAM